MHKFILIPILQMGKLRHRVAHVHRNHLGGLVKM